MRLFESAQGIRLTVPYTHAQLSQALEETVAANKMRDCYIRLVVTRGVGYLGVSPKNCMAAGDHHHCRQNSDVS